MKRFLLCTVLAAALPVLAQTTINPNAKVDPKNNKVSRPVVEKPKQVLLTRDQLRSCLKQSAANNVEAEEVKAAQEAQTKERAELLAAREALNKGVEALNAEAQALKAEREALVKTNEGLKEALAKLSKEEGTKMIADFKARAAALDPRIDAFNAGKTKLEADGKAFDTRIGEHNKATEALRARTDAHLDEVDEWKSKCANKPYDEADEIAVRKELGLSK